MDTSKDLWICMNKWIIIIFLGLPWLPLVLFKITLNFENWSTSWYLTKFAVSPPIQNALIWGVSIAWLNHSPSSLLLSPVTSMVIFLVCLIVFEICIYVHLGFPVIPIVFTVFWHLNLTDLYIASIFCFLSLYGYVRPLQISLPRESITQALQYIPIVVVRPY